MSEFPEEVMEGLAKWHPLHDDECDICWLRVAILQRDARIEKLEEALRFIASGETDRWRQVALAALEEKK